MKRAAPPLRIERLKRLAWLLDNSVKVPGLNYRIGLDPLIGLLPGIGEAVGAVLSMYIVIQAAQGGLPRSIVLRMGLNIAVEVVIGAIPLIGDLFDMAWKANARNIRLIERYAAAPVKSNFKSTLLLWSIVVALAVLIVVLVYGGILIMGALWSALQRAAA